MNQNSKLVDLRCQRNVEKSWFNSEKTIEFIAKGLPSEDSQNLDPQVRKHIQKHLASPIMNVVTLAPELEGLPTPKIILEFNQTSNQSFSEVETQTTYDKNIFDPSSLVKEPEFTLDQLVLSPEIKSRINTLLNALQKLSLIEQWGYDVGGAVLLYGASGVGKTTVVHAIAKALGMKNSYSQLWTARKSLCGSNQSEY
jgi:chromosomal replication initiation ATPase DnaA